MDPLRAGFDEIGGGLHGIYHLYGPAGLVAAGFEGLDAVDHPLLGLGPPPGAGVAGHLAGIGRQRCRHRRQHFRRRFHPHHPDPGGGGHGCRPGDKGHIRPQITQRNRQRRALRA